MAKRMRAGVRAAAGLGALAFAVASLAPGGAVRADPANIVSKADEKAAQELRLRGVEDTMRASDEQRRRIEADVESLRADRARLNAALIDTTAEVQDAERRIAEANDRLASLNANADALARSLENRRDVIADVLAALQRMGRDPPPAILVKPQDMAEAIRAAMALSSTVGELETETAALKKDLDELASLRASIAKERDAQAQRSASLALEKTRLAALIDARQQSLSDAAQALGAQRERAAQLGEQA
jgi:septal ring factor EnvC (AmiA/AmiB activator)